MVGVVPVLMLQKRQDVRSPGGGLLPVTVPIMNDGEFCTVKAIGQIRLSNIESELAEASEGWRVVAEVRVNVSVAQ